MTATVAVTKRASLAALSLSAASVFCACHDDCDPKKPEHCEANAIVECMPPCGEGETPCGPTLHYQSCGHGICIEQPDTAFCAMSQKRDDRCDGDVGSWCMGSTVVGCFRGYAVSQMECSQPPLQTKCALDPKNRAGCLSIAGDGRVCSGETGNNCK